MADKRQLTDRFLRSLPPAKHGTRNDIWDTVVPPSALASTTRRTATRRGAARPVGSPSS